MISAFHDLDREGGHIGSLRGERLRGKTAFYDGAAFCDRYGAASLFALGIAFD